MSAGDKTFERRWRERFESFARAHADDAGVAGWSPTGLAARLRHFRRRWRPGALGALWLDVGCGAGTYARFLAGRGARVLGLDYSLPSVRHAERHGGERLAWGVADVTRLPLADGAADGALCFGVLQALATSDAAVASLTRALKPGAELWLDALNAHCLPHLVERAARRLQGRPPHVRYETPRALKRLLRAHGCGQVRVYWVPILPARLQRYQPLLETPAAETLLRALPGLGALFCHAFVITGRRDADARHAAG